MVELGLYPIKIVVMNKEQLERLQIKQAYQKKHKQIKTVKIKPKSRDIISELEYDTSHGKFLSRQTPRVES